MAILVSYSFLYFPTSFARESKTIICFDSWSKHCLYPLESFIGNRTDSSGKQVSNNILYLRHFIRKSNLLHNVFDPRCEMVESSLLEPSLLQTIRLLFTHWSLEFPLDCPTFGFPDSQRAAYSHPDEDPLFGRYKLSVNVDLLLHIANFFKYHIATKEEATLFHPFNDLPDDDKPRAWKGQIQDGLREIGRSWLGSYGKSL